MTSPLDESYFSWLAAKVIINDHPARSYWSLLEDLYEFEFVAQVPGDDNRAEDGEDLREDFLTETGYNENQEWRSVGTSMLEMLWALAVRAEWQTEFSAPEWFWKFINNLGLRDCRDDHYNQDYVIDILATFVEREYEGNGQGGLFPLRNPHEDQREVEIWYQLSAYLAEHTEIGL